MSNPMFSTFFISYSRVDSAFALQLVRDLKVRGVAVWMDQLDIPPGANWDEEIERALAQARVVLVILSQSSASSENVKNEISHALELKKQVVPIVLTKGAVPLMITRLQREDFTGDYAEALNRLVMRLGGGGRTAALEAITPEQVERISATSAERLATSRTSAPGYPMRGSSAAVAHGDSLEPAVGQVRAKPPQGAGKRRLMLGAFALAGVVGIGALIESLPSESPEPLEAAGAEALPTEPSPVESGASAPESPPEVVPVPAELPASPPSPEPQPTAKAPSDVRPQAPRPAEPEQGPAEQGPAEEARPEPAGVEDAPAEGPAAYDDPWIDDPEANRSIAGSWMDGSGATARILQSGASLRVSLPNRAASLGSISGDSLSVRFDSGCCNGRVSRDGRSIHWDNNTSWSRR
jgi:hypothetical protein